MTIPLLFPIDILCAFDYVLLGWFASHRIRAAEPHGRLGRPFTFLEAIRATFGPYERRKEKCIENQVVEAKSNGLSIRTAVHANL